MTANNPRNVTTVNTTATPIDSNRMYRSSDNIIEKIAAFIVFPVVWFFSLIGNLLVKLLSIAVYPCAGFLMLASVYVCTENYYQLLNYGNLANFFRMALSNIYTVITIAIAFLLFLTVEHFQSEGLRAWISASNQKRVTGKASFDPMIAAGAIATLAEGVSMLYRFFWQGFDFLAIVSIFAGLFGYKLGDYMLSEAKKVKLNYQISVAPPTAPVQSVAPPASPAAGAHTPPAAPAKRK